jgi:hypothetical protein
MKVDSRRLDKKDETDAELTLREKLQAKRERLRREEHESLRRAWRRAGRDG